MTGSFRSVYFQPDSSGDFGLSGRGSPQFHISVVGMHMPFSMVETPRGRAQNDWFLFSYEDPVKLSFIRNDGVNTEMKRFPSGAVVIHQPGSFIRAYPENRSPGECSMFKRSWLRFNGTGVNGILKNVCLFPETVYICRDPADSVSSGIADIFHELEHPVGYDNEILLSMFYILLRNIKRDSNNKSEKSRVKYPENENGLKSRFLNVKHIMERRYLEDLNLDILAVHAGVSKGHFSRKFRELFNVTPYAYLSKLRLEHSADLLANRDLDIANIAEICGFCDPFHYSRSFKTMYGISPAAFRKNT